MSYLNTLLFAGTDLRSLAGVTIDGYLDIRAPGTRRGSHDVIPGRRGQVGAQLPYDAYEFSVPILVRGSSLEEMEDRLDAVGVLLAGTNGLGQLERHRATATGGGHKTMTAAGAFNSGLSYEILNPVTGKTELSFTNLDGAWTPDGGTTWVVP